MRVYILMIIWVYKIKTGVWIEEKTLCVKFGCI
jgi:hypothetical protein